jgi:hypothetical protein
MSSSNSQFPPYNYFKVLENPSFSDSELKALLKNYPNTTELDGAVRSLLIATRTFRDATALNSDLIKHKDIRDSTNTDNDLLAILDKVATAIETAQRLRDAQKEASPTNFQTFENAMSYSLGSIAERLRTLKELDDKVYKLYAENPHNKLIKVLPPVMLAPGHFKAR